VPPTSFDQQTPNEAAVTVDTDRDAKVRAPRPARPPDLRNTYLRQGPTVLCSDSPPRKSRALASCRQARVITEVTSCLAAAPVGDDALADRVLEVLHNHAQEMPSLLEKPSVNTDSLSAQAWCSHAVGIVPVTYPAFWATECRRSHKRSSVSDC
jgi:hypothetical protein